LVPDEGWLTVALLAATLYTTLHSVEAAGWGERVVATPPLGLLAVAVGLLAAKSPLRTPWAMLLGIAIGAEAVLLSQAVLSPGGSWAEKLGWLSRSLRPAFEAALLRAAAYDPLVFATLVAAIGYLLGLCSSWLVFRLQSGWWALVLIATAGLVHLSYVTVDSIPPYLASLLLGALTVASLELHLRRSTWRAVGLPVQAASTTWTLTAACGLAGLALFVALQLPAGQINAELASRYQALTDPWKDFQRQVDRLVGGGRGQARPGSGLLFSQSLTPREDFDPGTEPVLKIASPQQRYWRAMTYHLYTGHSVETGDTSERRYDAGQELPVDEEGGDLRTNIQQKVTVLSPSAAALFAAEAPRSFSVPLLADERRVGWDLAALRPAVALRRGESYSVISAVPLAGRRELAEAAAAYPPWTEPYLELPVSLPVRVGELSNQITADARNPLERALAIEAYLRGLTYSTHTVAPPPDRDWVDFLLFDSRSGYCDYFATAMAVMLRTQGIPARVASGFAPGTFDAQEKVWLVRDSEAHSWTEAYFPGYGWQTFEPSALRPTPDRPETGRPDANRQRAAPAAVGGPGDLEGSPDDGSEGFGQPSAPRSAEPTPVGMTLGLLAVLLLGGGLGLAALAHHWERGLAGEPPARRRYAHLRRWLRWGALRIPDSATPYEVARGLKSSLPQLAEPLDRLVQRHVEATYGPGPGPGSADESEAAWLDLRAPLAKAMLRRRLSRSGRNFRIALFAGARSRRGSR
jgi:transglutaminase-like putative cysteine protease